MPRFVALFAALILTGCARQSDGGVQAAPEPEDRSEEIAVITSVIQSHRNEITSCYAVQLAGDSTLQGRLDVDFTIDRGQVTQVEVVNNTTEDQTLSRCISQRIKEWTFPEEIHTEVSYPFTLNSSMDHFSTP